MPSARRSTARIVRVLVAAAAVALAAGPVEAQYFGRNKVQYRNFDFKIMKTRHFDIYYYPEEEAAVEMAGRLAERWYTRLSRVLGHQFVQRQPVILYAAHTHFEQTNTLSGFIGEGTGGVTELFKRRVILPMAGPLGETDHVLGHELVHAFQFDITGNAGPVSSGNIPGALSMPLWFIEGMAEYLSIGPVDAHTAMWMRDAIQQDKPLPRIDQLNNPEYFPYRWGQALWAYLAGRWGDGIVADALKAGNRGGEAERILEVLTGVPIKELSEQWHKSLREAYGPVIDSREKPERVARALITEKNGGEMNLAPSISPDGERLTFLSEKDLYSIDVYMADARTGEVKDKIISTATDPHFESLQFINSAGGWDPAGRRFAMGAIRKGRATLAIRTVSGGKEQEFRFTEVDEIFDPTFSPDGRRVAFSALKGGLLDLWTYDLQSKALLRLTSDAFADLQPAWSPDGRSIAFVTDRFTTKLENLMPGEYRLAAVDPQGAAIRELPSFEDAKNIDPQWSADGSSLYFLSDRNGSSNVYRLDVGTGEMFQLTNVSTGVSGITALSPSLSVARDRVVFSMYEDGKYRIYVIEGPERMAGGPIREPAERLRASTLPPQDRAPGQVASFERQPNAGLPAKGTFEIKDYKPKLTLDYIGQPTLTLGADPRGAFVGGGVSFLFSDILGEHTLGAVLQVNGEFRDFGGIIGYENRRHRWTWGASIEQIPYLTGAYASGVTVVDGRQVFVEQQELFRETSRSLNGYVAYPFSRQSRIEFGAAGRNIGFSHEVRTNFFTIGGDFLGDEREDLEAPEGVTFGEVTTALVYDSALFGPTSPILGRRYRFEVTPTFGQLRYTGILADFRQYVMPIRPLTLAGRLLHYGRYGSGGEDERFTPLFVGYPNLVRGYDVNSFSASECGTESARCPVFDQLLGSRLAIANVEARLPLLGIFRGRNLYGPLPIELIGFYDIGVAWTANDRARFIGGARGDDARDPVASTGYGIRANIFGYAVIELDRVKPLNRPGKGWMWVFNFSPGF